MIENQLLELTKRIKSISDTGLVYAESEYDKERYEELLSISLELFSLLSGTEVSEVTNFFNGNKDYPTAKVDVRGMVLNEKKEILLVQEKIDGKWTLPGGWADVGYAPSEVVRKEIQEETGLESNVLKLLAVYDKKCHPHPPQPFYVYKLMFLCEITGGVLKPSFDIEAAAYFDLQNLPELSEDRILESQIKQLYSAAENGSEEVFFD